MRIVRLLTGLVAAVFLLVPAARAAETSDIKILRPTVVSTRPHDRTAFTQGLEIEDGVLYESTGLYRRSSLRRVNPDTGEVLKSMLIPDNQFGEGITVVGDKIYMLTWREGLAHVFDRETFELQKTHKYAGEGWGLAYDGEHLIMSDGTERLTMRDPETFDVVSSVTVTLRGQPLGLLNELEYVDGFIWANVYQSNAIVKIDPASGKVVAGADIIGNQFLSPEERLKCDVLNGIAYDSENKTFLITGKLWPKMFEVVFIETDS